MNLKGISLVFFFALTACVSKAKYRQQLSAYELLQARELRLVEELQPSKLELLKLRDQTAVYQARLQELEAELAAERSRMAAYVSAVGEGQQARLALEADLNLSRQKLAELQQALEACRRFLEPPKDLMRDLREAWPSGEREEHYRFGLEGSHLLLVLSEDWLVAKGRSLRLEPRALEDLQRFLPIFRAYPAYALELRAYHTGPKAGEATKHQQRANQLAVLLAQWLLNQDLAPERIKAEQHWLSAPQVLGSKDWEKNYNRIEIRFRAL